MTARSVLVAAAALREFSLDEIAASCDEGPHTIVAVLDALPSAVRRVQNRFDTEQGQRWQVIDRAELRRLLRSTADPADPRATAGPAPGPCPASAAERLRHAEETLVKCGAEPSAERRQVLVGTAVNHLRQAVAADRREGPWWRVELGDRFEEELSQRADPETAARLRLDMTVARLALGDAANRPVTTSDVLNRAGQLRTAATLLCGEERLRELVRGFVDLATARLVTGHGVVDRLVIAIARRRVRAQVGSDLDGALRALEPLVRGASAPGNQSGDLYRTLRHLPDGSDHALVYTDLLSLLPARLRCHPHRERLPGVLVEVTAEPAVADHLSRYARRLESDLRNSPYQSDKALIGQAAHVLQDLTFNDGVGARGDQTRVELLTLATAPLWPAPATGPGRAP